MCELLQGFPAGEGRGDVNGTMTFLQLGEENIPLSAHFPPPGSKQPPGSWSDTQQEPALLFRHCMKVSRY